MKYREKSESEIKQFTPIETHPWVIREKQRHALVDAYLDQYKNTMTWHQACREKWDGYLLSYIRAVAWVQAQMIVEGGSGIGWDGQTIFGAGVQITNEMKRQFFGDCRRQAEKGDIDVAIPTDRIADWKKTIAYQQEWLNHKTDQKTIQHATTPSEKSALEMEIERQIAEKVA